MLLIDNRPFFIACSLLIVFCHMLLSFFILPAFTLLTGKVDRQKMMIKNDRQNQLQIDTDKQIRIC